jgi:hypothetical protein
MKTEVRGIQAWQTKSSANLKLKLEIAIVRNRSLHKKTFLFCHKHFLYLL